LRFNRQNKRLAISEALCVTITRCMQMTFQRVKMQKQCIAAVHCERTTNVTFQTAATAGSSTHNAEPITNVQSASEDQQYVESWNGGCRRREYQAV